MMALAPVRMLLAATLALASLSAVAQEFALVVSPPRFEDRAKPGTTYRNVFELNNTSAKAAKFSVETADWTLDVQGAPVFSQSLAKDSCRPWVGIETNQITVKGNGKRRFRFEVAVPADAPRGECRFAIMIEGEPQPARGNMPLPISGRIGKSSVTQGALVTANQAAPLAKVQQLDPMYVDVTQSSAELLELRKQLAASNVEDARDQPVTILLEDGTPYGHDGKLAFSEVTVDPTTGSYGIRVVVPNPENILLPGMYVRAIVGSTVREGALLVPQQAIVRNSKGDPTAMVVGKDDKIEVRAVQVSRAIGDKWLVEGGLAAGERVVVEGFQKIRPGVTVQAVEAGAQPPAAAASPQQ